jgi:hypothetical protein
MGSLPSSEGPAPEGPAPPTAASEDPELDALRALIRGGPGLPGLDRTLPRLQRAHRKELLRVERWTYGELARHPEPRELIRSWRRPGNIDEHDRIRRIFDARRVLVADVHENRVVRYAVVESRRRLRDRAETGDPAAPALLAELEIAAAQAPFLDEVSDLRGSPREPTATLQRDPLYRTIFHGVLALPAS